MDIDDHRALAGKLRARFVHEATDLTSIKALPVYELWGGKAVSVESSGLACSPTAQLSGDCIDGICITRRMGPTQGEAEISIVLVPLHPGNNARRHFGRRPLFATRCIHHVQHAAAVLVD